LIKGKRIEVKTRISACRDSRDNHYLETALAAKADFLITGDKNLLEIPSSTLNSIGLDKLAVITPRKFVELSLKNYQKGTVYQ